MNRKKEQSDLFYQLGQLTGPVLKMIENLDSYDRDERARIAARFSSDRFAFFETIHKYCNGEPHHKYDRHAYLIQGVLNDVHNMIAPLYQEKDKEQLLKNLESAKTALFTIPVPIDSAIHEARTPFSTYCLVKDLCTSSLKGIMWMDRYFNQSLFSHYFVDVPKDTRVTLVTWPESECSSARDKQRYADFMGISKLFAAQRGPEKYHLLTDDNFHDRWLSCDDKYFALGGSIKDLGNDTTFTISKLDSTEANRDQFRDVLKRGTEIFGPKSPAHP